MMMKILFSFLATTLLLAQAASSSSSSSSSLPTPQDLLVDPTELTQAYPAFAEFEGSMYAGSLPMDHEDRSGFLQFWLYVPDAPTVPDTLVTWFNGGPGCSSFSAGIFFELGPVTIPQHEVGWCCQEAHEELVSNPHAWTKATVMLFVEQPIGVGFSRGTNGTPAPASEDDVGADFDAFLQNFYKVFDGRHHGGSTGALDLTSHKHYLAGESYAGIYIPSVARAIYLNNLKAAKQDSQDNDRFHIPLAGIAIGNGKIDAMTQGPASIDFAYYHGLIDGTAREYFNKFWDTCMDHIQTQEPFGVDGGDPVPPEPLHEFNIREDCGILDAILEASGEGAMRGKLENGPNFYEYSTWDGYIAGATVSSFYNDPIVQRSLNVPKEATTKWMGCVPEDQRFMGMDTPWSTLPYIAQLLDEAEIDVLYFSGVNDIILCTAGAEESFRKMIWSGTQQAAEGDTVVNEHRNAWTEAPRSLWVYQKDGSPEDDMDSNAVPAGYIQSYKNMNFLTVYNAGHMVPYNQPGPSLDMITRFLKGESFHDRPLPKYSPAVSPLPTSTATGTKDYARQTDMVKNKDRLMAPPAALSHVTTIVVVAVAVAFALGYGVAQLTKGRRSGYSSVD